MDGDLGLPKKGGVIALERGLAILMSFNFAKDALRLTDLAKITGLNKSTVLRLCTSLERQGFVKRREDGRFQLGSAVFMLGEIYKHSLHIVELVAPVMRNLVDKVNESATFTVLEGDSVVCLHKVESSQAIRDAGSLAGDRYDLNRGGASSTVLRAFSGETGAPFDELRKNILAESHGALFPDAAAVACPIFGMDGAMVGAIQLSGPQSRFTPDYVKNIKNIILEAAAEITRTLGGNTVVYAEAKTD